MLEVEVFVLADVETNLKAQSWSVACSERVVGGQRHAPYSLHGICSIVLNFLWILDAFSYAMAIWHPMFLTVSLLTVS
jgi:hypothetical protein